MGPVHQQPELITVFNDYTPAKTFDFLAEIKMRGVCRCSVADRLLPIIMYWNVFAFWQK